MSSTSEIKSTKVEYRRLGQSGLRVSVPIFGCMSFGSEKWVPWVIKEEDALPLLKAAWDHGLTTWDTANMYSHGESERIIGKAIKKYNIPRHRLTILTKCFFIAADDPSMQSGSLYNTRDYINNYGLSRTAIFNQVEASLARLDTPYIDLLQIHRADLDNTPAEETMKALHDLVQSGKVRYIGASSMWAWQLAHYNHVAEKNGWTKFVSMQNHYSLVYREEEREMNKYCKFAGIGLIPWGPLNGGQLARPFSARAETMRGEGRTKDTPVSPHEEEIVNRVEKVAKDKGWKMSQVALAWINEKVTSPIVGFSSVQRMEEAIIPDFKLTDDDVKFLEEPYQPTNIRGHK